jgi:hypothetical protein
MDWELAPKTAIVSNSVSKTLKIELSSPCQRKAVAEACTNAGSFVSGKRVVCLTTFWSRFIGKSSSSFMTSLTGVAIRRPFFLRGLAMFHDGVVCDPLSSTSRHCADYCLGGLDLHLLDGNHLRRPSSSGEPMHYPNTTCSPCPPPAPNWSEYSKL